MEDERSERSEEAESAENNAIARADEGRDRPGEPQRMSQRTVLQRFLAGPPMDLLDENGRAPTRDQIYDDDPK